MPLVSTDSLGAIILNFWGKKRPMKEGEEPLFAVATGTHIVRDLLWDCGAHDHRERRRLCQVAHWFSKMMAAAAGPPVTTKLDRRVGN